MPSTVLLPIWLPAQGAAASALAVSPPAIDEGAVGAPTVIVGQIVTPSAIDEGAVGAPTVVADLLATPDAIDESSVGMPTLSLSGALVALPSAIDESALGSPTLTLEGDLPGVALTVIGFVGEGTYVAANADGNRVQNDGLVVLHIVNAGGAPRTVTAFSRIEDNQGWLHHETVTVPAGESRLFGPFEPRRFNDADQSIRIGYDSATGLSLAALQLIRTP